jgi:hypothetical protein
MSAFNQLVEKIDNIKQKMSDGEYLEIMKILGKVRLDLLDDATYSTLVDITRYNEEIETVEERVRHLIKRLYDLPRMLDTIYQLSAERFGLFSNNSYSI